MTNLPEMPIPAFEGRPVEAVTVKVAGSAPLDDLGDTVLSVDDRVQLLSIYTVTAVRHEVDSNTGNLTRVQVLKPVEMHLMPFDETDPNDDGIIRAIMPGHTVNGGSDRSAGIVAYGIQFSDGTCVLRWATGTASTNVYDSLADLEAIHGHAGKTTVEWID